MAHTFAYLHPFQSWVQLIQSPGRPFIGEGMGRLTVATRASFEDHLHRMRTEYKEALVSKGRREAFDRLVEAWSAELGAISYAESLSLMDLILLTGEVDNRAYLETLRVKMESLDARLNEAVHSRASD